MQARRLELECGGEETGTEETGGEGKRPEEVTGEEETEEVTGEEERQKMSLFPCAHIPLLV